MQAECENGINDNFSSSIVKMWAGRLFCEAKCEVPVLVKGLV